ncbi:unnamed protein product [Gongylonema pulchrum]|uniref:GRAM domain-containing protein n=1 Tax=Gongylonema pulchrum TaxID=637853 RepID=A0A183D4B3_9BILA|nr:unnamed protein product [Gongylonema pulchrum]
MSFGKGGSDRVRWDEEEEVKSMNPLRQLIRSCYQCSSVDDGCMYVTTYAYHFDLFQETKQEKDKENENNGNVGKSNRSGSKAWKKLDIDVDYSGREGQGRRGNSGLGNRNDHPPKNRFQFGLILQHKKGHRAFEHQHHNAPCTHPTFEFSLKTSMILTDIINL